MRIIKIIKIFRKLKKLSVEMFQLSWYDGIEKDTDPKIAQRYIDCDHEKNKLLNNLWCLIRR